KCAGFFHLLSYKTGKSLKSNTQFTMKVDKKQVCLAFKNLNYFKGYLIPILYSPQVGRDVISLTSRLYFTPLYSYISYPCREGSKNDAEYPVYRLSYHRKEGISHYPER